jgi:diadenosine hexaphosphate hydrolase (ATP-forming)
LLLLQARTNGGVHWVFPKGHIEPLETAEGAALRELMEEAGVSVEATERPLGRVTYLLDGPYGRISKSVQWFLVKCDPSAVPLPRRDEGFQEARWLRAGEALSLLTYESDRELLRKAVDVCE